MSLTDAAVSKFSFIEHPTHHMDGDRISMANHKSVEICIIFESGTYICNIDPMKREKQEEIILRKYTSVINDIKDIQFENDSLRAAMLCMYLGGKKQLTGPTLWRKMEKVMTDTKLFFVKVSWNDKCLRSTQWVDSVSPYEKALYLLVGQILST